MALAARMVLRLASAALGVQIEDAFAGQLQAQAQARAHSDSICVYIAVVEALAVFVSFA